jgi:succinate-semialdehyde dehydrogenase/glutarate-semialdehyde dehydrogenase
MAYQTINPFNGKTVQTFDTVTDPQLETKIAAATAAFEKWREISYAERAKIVAKVGELMLAHIDALAKTMTLEMGKRISESRGEVDFSARILSLLCKECRKVSGTRKTSPGTWHCAYGEQPDRCCFLR